MHRIVGGGQRPCCRCIRGWPGPFGAAENAYKAAIDADAKAGEAHNNLAVVYMLTGRLDDSTKEIVLAEKVGYHVNPQFKKDLEDKRKGRR